MAVKETNHRISVTLTEGEYADLLALGADLGVSSASKAAAECVRGRSRLADEVEGLRLALGWMAGELVDVSWTSGRWRNVNVQLMRTAGFDDVELRETRAAILMQFDGPTYMSSQYRRAYEHWCAENGCDTYL